MIVSFLYVLIWIFNVSSQKISVETKQGNILGTKEKTIFEEKIFYSFYGVPYAQSPTGRLRFKDPKPVKKFKLPFDARMEYHGACAQAHIVHKHALYGNEDCLHLNIYTPYLPTGKKETLKPVIVWIHGYAFTSSFSHVHGPDFLIENDIVFITLTHRIGAFGFLKLNESDSNGNMGLKDIVIGLRWINKNIEYFGGDKSKITLMGSGSASSFLSLLLITKYNILFSKMILQSGSIFSPSIFQGDSKEEKIKLEKIIKAAGFKDIKTASSIGILNSSKNVYNNKEILNFQRPVVPFSPISEIQTNKSLLTKSRLEIYKTISHMKRTKPILVGFTSQESISEVIPFIHNPHYLQKFGNIFKFMVPFADGCKLRYSSRKYKEVGNLIKHQYFKNNITEDSLNDFLELSSDLHKYPIYKFIDSQLKSGNKKLYVYKFDYIGNLNIFKTTSIGDAKTRVKGAAQGDEICYILKCEPLYEHYIKLKKNRNDTDTKFIKQISEIWANFAKFADPTPNSKIWLPITKIENDIFIFGKQNKRVNSKPEQKMFKFWNEIYTRNYAAENCLYARDEL